MNDRLKFRAFVKDCLFTDENDNDYKKSFMIDGVGVFGGCSVGVYTNDLENQLEEQGFSKDEIEQVKDYGLDFDSNWFNFDADVIMQCTGLKDKNGKLIYEGDILSLNVNSPRKGFVEYYRNAFCFNENHKYSNDLIFSEKSGEIIGNIYQNPDRLFK